MIYLSFWRLVRPKELHCVLNLLCGFIDPVIKGSLFPCIMIQLLKIEWFIFVTPSQEASTCRCAIFYNESFLASLSWVNWGKFSKMILSIFTYAPLPDNFFQLLSLSLSRFSLLSISKIILYYYCFHSFFRWHCLGQRRHCLLWNT